MKQKKTLWILIVSQIIYSLFIFVWLFIAGMSVMGFDSPQAATDPTTWLIFSYILLYPVGLLIALIAGWVCYSRRKYKAALIWNGIPLIWILPMLGLIAYVIFS
ncbi:hypothetical protein Back11_14360 [Paenibacillus baekrokdamisoli]|uniref:Uncharacterized protein n=1 Tax=Paenibacillus baekrokdamisoli TaxID=1712516 RepID=A0A3G9J2N7_9BACL|nr:hypothetical protein [Paenibacillus baekrokdamisoli]MBB3070742.1 uncharacterized SAM-binding protein YcdF (DUF218 family) [Paenibacillus baekrokdamisoli]BBH20091.1 hypothetical protein Back11_14360 [Paenibacillus baekrokdamisoli]